MYLAIKEIKKEKGRFAMIVLVMIFIAYLVYFLSGLAYGLASINRTAVDYWKAETIVLSTAANTNALASSISDEAIRDLKLNSDHALKISAITLTLDDKKVDGVFMGYKEDAIDTIVPLKVGRYPQNTREIIVTQNIVDKYNVSLDQMIAFNKDAPTYKIVGFTENANFNTRPVFYGSRDIVIAGKGGEPVESYAAVLGFNNEPLVSEDYQRVSIADFIDKLPGYKPQILTFGLMIGSLSIIAAVIIGVFMYILTMQKKPIFGVLKVQGFKNRTIMHSIVIQTLLLVAMGLGLGYLLTFLTIVGIQSFVPVAMNGLLIGAVTVAMMLFALIGAAFSARIILKIDPLQSL